MPWIIGRAFAVAYAWGRSGPTDQTLFPRRCPSVGSLLCACQFARGAAVRPANPQGEDDDGPAAPRGNNPAGNGRHVAPIPMVVHARPGGRCQGPDTSAWHPPWRRFGAPGRPRSGFLALLPTLTCRSTLGAANPICDAEPTARFVGPGATPMCRARTRVMEPAGQPRRRCQPGRPAVLLARDRTRPATRGGSLSTESSPSRPPKGADALQRSP